MAIEGQRPSEDIPRLSCDFNATGWSGEPDDDCCYGLDRERLGHLKPIEGMRVVIYEEDLGEQGEPQVFGCIATLEFHKGKASSGWRARPIPGAFYRDLQP